MLQQIGVDHIALERPPFHWVAVAVGVTRAGCRAGVPQTAGSAAGLWRSTTMVSGRSSDASLVSQAEFPVPTRRLSGRAPLARTLNALAVSVVAYRHVDPAWARLSASLRRVAWYAVVGRPGRIYRECQSWRSIWRGERWGEVVSDRMSSLTRPSRLRARGDRVQGDARMCSRVCSRVLAGWRDSRMMGSVCRADQDPSAEVTMPEIVRPPCRFVIAPSVMRPTLGRPSTSRRGTIWPAMDRRASVPFADRVVAFAARAFRDGWRARMWPIVSDEVRDTLVSGAVIDAIRNSFAQAGTQRQIMTSDVFDLHARLLLRLENGLLGVQLITDARRVELGKLPVEIEAMVERRIVAAGAELALSEQGEACRLRGELAQLSGENARILVTQAQLAGALDEIGQTPDRVEAERYQRLEHDRRLAWGRLARRDEDGVSP